MTARATAVLALVGALALGGCSRGVALPAPLPTDVPYAYHLQTSAGGAGALLEGVLDLIDGCLVVLPQYEGTEQEMAPVVPVLPVAVTSWDGTTLEINGERATVGEPISLGGGGATTRTEAQFVPEGCPEVAGENTFFVGVF